MLEGVRQHLKPTEKLIVTDPDVCVGCITCQLICSLSHEGEFSPTLARLRMTKNPFEALYVPEVCKHCTTPACYYACPVPDAMVTDRETGVVVIDEEKCIACGRCAEACLLNLIVYSPSRNVYLKCDLCGGEPKCVAWCPANALKYVRRKEVGNR